MSKLYLVPTPIGNLEDITLRALRILKEVDFILAEDTRSSRILLQHFHIQTPLVSHHKFNEHQALPKIIERLRNGETAALISDAGTPGISDPGFLLVRECLRENIPVECLPGPTALIPALVESGLPCDRFYFEGFLPVKKGRKTRITRIAERDETTIIYESPHRILRTLAELSAVLGLERKVSVSREISKIFHETIRGTLAELVEWAKSKPLKGEFVIVIGGKQDAN